MYYAAGLCAGLTGFLLGAGIVSVYRGDLAGIIGIVLAPLMAAITYAVFGAARQT